MSATIRVPGLPAFLDGDAPSPDDVVIVYDSSTGITRKALISDLPFSGTGGGGGGTITYASALWKVHTYSPGYHYDETKSSCTISDLRLLGINDGVITSTQVGGEFRDDQLVFDPEAGTVTLPNFELVPNEHITININGAVNYAYNNALQTAIKNLADQAAIMAPFKPTLSGPSSAKVLWMRPANEIPAGWQECVAMRGKLPMGQDLADNDFKGTVGVASGGSKGAKLTMDNIPEHSFQYRTTDLGGPPSDQLTNNQLRRDDDIGLYLGRTLNTNKMGKADPDAVNLLNPYRIVMWIEFTGLD